MQQLWVGLGNPGEEYAQTRHNAGFHCIDALVCAEGCHFEESSKFSGLYAKTAEGYFLKPSTFMNHSGQSVGAMAHFYKIEVEHIIVIHDDLDLLPGQIRLKQGGGNGGHNGLKSIENTLGSNNFWRVRLGVGHPRSLNLNTSVVNFVLSAAPPEQRAQTQNAINSVVQHFQLLKNRDFAAAQRILHALK